jgi:hypothetical protein
MKKVFVYYCPICKDTFEKVFKNGESKEHCNCPSCEAKSKLDWSYEEE